MQTGLLRLMALVPPIDVAPPSAIIGLGIGLLIVVCGLVAVVAVVAFFVIRAVKKNRAAKDVPPAQNNPTAPNP